MRGMQSGAVCGKTWEALALWAALVIWPGLAWGADVSGKVELYEKTLLGSRLVQTVENVILFLLPKDDATRERLKTMPLKTEWLDQRNKEFAPHVLAVQKGAKVRFGNEDPWFHNIYSREPAFDLGRYPKGYFKEQVFEKVGISHVFCDIHNNMHAIVLVVDTPLYTRTEPDGAFKFEKIPPGAYALTAWQERSEAVTLEIQVSEADLAELTLTLKETRRSRVSPPASGAPYERSLLKDNR